jgi:ferredoxin-NADP reductase
MPVPIGPTPRPGFRILKVASKQPECVDVVSFVLEPSDGKPLTLPLPGQYIVLRIRLQPDGPALFRSYSLSALPSQQQYRISVKVEPHGAGGSHLSGDVDVGDLLEVSDPRGSFTLMPGEEPVVLLSAGIGLTPVLAMLHALAAGKSARSVWWLHGARDGATRSFAGEPRTLLATLLQARSRVWYSEPSADDRPGIDYDAKGRMDVATLAQLGVPRSGDFYLCGPPPFLADLRKGLVAWGVAAERIHSEIFAGGPALMPGVVGTLTRPPHPPSGDAGTGPLVSFARSGIAVRWRRPDETLLELAEACDVPVRWSCRSGVCHNCESGVVSGSIAYDPEPLDPPSDGNVLICCARPMTDVVIDL